MSWYAGVQQTDMLLAATAMAVTRSTKSPTSQTLRLECGGTAGQCNKEHLVLQGRHSSPNHSPGWSSTELYCYKMLNPWGRVFCIGATCLPSYATLLVTATVRGRTRTKLVQIGTCTFLHHMERFVQARTRFGATCTRQTRTDCRAYNIAAFCSCGCVQHRAPRRSGTTFCCKCSDTWQLEEVLV